MLAFAFVAGARVRGALEYIDKDIDTGRIHDGLKEIVIKQPMQGGGVPNIYDRAAYEFLQSDQELRLQVPQWARIVETMLPHVVGYVIGDVVTTIRAIDVTGHSVAAPRTIANHIEAHYGI